ncbi:hypothetical protein HK405_006889, partial [Cladochytrium tenue]
MFPVHQLAPPRPPLPPPTAHQQHQQPPRPRRPPSWRRPHLALRLGRRWRRGVGSARRWHRRSGRWSPKWQQLRQWRRRRRSRRVWPGRQSIKWCGRSASSAATAAAAEATTAAFAASPAAAATAAAGGGSGDGTDHHGFGRAGCDRAAGGTPGIGAQLPSAAASANTTSCNRRKRAFGRTSRPLLQSAAQHAPKDPDAVLQK